MLQSSILEPTLFLIAINDLSYVISSQLRIYTEEITINSCHNRKTDRPDNVNLAATLENDLQTEASRFWRLQNETAIF